MRQADKEAYYIHRQMSGTLMRLKLIDGVSFRLAYFGGQSTKIGTWPGWRI